MKLKKLKKQIKNILFKYFIYKIICFEKNKYGRTIDTYC